MKMPEHKPKIRRGQIWRKRDGVYDIKVIIRNKAKKDFWRTVNINNRKSSHHIREKDLYLFYELIGASSNNQSHNIK